MTLRISSWLASAAALLLATACGSPETRERESGPRAPLAIPSGGPEEPRLEEPLFVESAVARGLDFAHENGRTGLFRYCEMMGGGVALLDFDRDGDLDVYVVQGGPLEGEDGPKPTDRLFRNELDPELGAETLRFVDVTAEAGIVADGYGMGALAADFDGDGWDDLYLTNLGDDQLWRNRGDGTFEDVTAASGIDNPVWSVSAAAFDAEGDGDLDVYVGNYLEYSVAADKQCTDELGAPNYCGPLSFPALTDRFFRNRGDGTFEDATAEAGLDAAFGGALGVAAVDADGDGHLDLYVANDGLPNQLWMNLGDGTFEDRGVLAGCALNDQGAAEAGMGVALADLDGDGDEDFAVGHLDGETNTIYVNDGAGLFVDHSARTGLGAPSVDRTTFGLAWLDADLDGDLDLMTANGAVKILKELALAGDPWPLHQPNQLFLREGDRWTEGAGTGLDETSEVSRGVATGDLDNDGDLDLVVHQNGGPVRLYLGRAADRGAAWLGLRLLEQNGELAVGASAQPEGARRAMVRRGDSYASTSDDRLFFGFGEEREPRDIEVRWADGVREAFPEVPVGAHATLQRGQGRTTGDPL